MAAPIDLAMLLLKQGPPYPYDDNFPGPGNLMGRPPWEEHPMGPSPQERPQGNPYPDPGPDPDRGNPYEQPARDCPYCNGTGQIGGGTGGGAPPPQPPSPSPYDSDHPYDPDAWMGDESIEHLERMKEQGYPRQYDPASMGFTPEAIARVQAQNKEMMDSWHQG